MSRMLTGEGRKRVCCRIPRRSKVASLWVLGALWAWVFLPFGSPAQEFECVLTPEKAGFVELRNGQFSYQEIWDNADSHPVKWIWSYWLLKFCLIQRTYVKFKLDVRGIPMCVWEGVNFYLTVNVLLQSREVEVYAVEWDGSRIQRWEDQPGGEYLGTISRLEPRIDVTEVVREYLQGVRENLAFMFKIPGEEGGCPPSPSFRFYSASFVNPCLSFPPVLVCVVDRLGEETVEQEDIATSRYITYPSPQEVEIHVLAFRNYRIEGCFYAREDGVSPPDPPLPPGAKPMELEYPPLSGYWFPVEPCGSGWTTLPGFPGTIGYDKETYRMRIDLAQLGDRATGERLTFYLEVRAVLLP